MFGAIAVVLALAGLWLGFSRRPRTTSRAPTVRIMFIHMPAAWHGEFVYACLAVASFLALVFRHVLADAAAQAAAPLGAGFTVLALVTGSLWGRPMWGTWWVWDARLTSVLVLFLIYIAYMALRASLDDETKAARAAAILALVGAVNLPIIHYSVDWWNSLHQGTSVFAPAAGAGAGLPLAAAADGAGLYGGLRVAVAGAHPRRGLAPPRRGRGAARGEGLRPMLDLDVGKYAAYIWPAYAITALVFVVLIAGSLAHARRWKKRAEELARQMSRMSRWRRPAADRARRAGARCSAGYALHRDPQVQPQALVGKPMPDLTLPSLDDGAPVRLRDAAAAGPVLVNFFASWCAPCEIEQPVLMQLKAQAASGSSASPTRTPRRTTQGASSPGWATPIAQRLVDRDGRAGIEFGVTGVPETYLIGQDGQVLAKHTGPLSEADAQALTRAAR